MTETAKVRIVRCPKCENLLPEVLHYSVYRCGGCGAVLSANDSDVDLEIFSEKLDVEMIGETIVEHLDRNTNIAVAEKSIAVPSDDSESDVKSSISALSQTKRGMLSCKADNCSKLMNIEEVDTDGIFHCQKIPPELEDSRIFKEDDNFRGSGRFMNGRMDSEVITYRKEGPLNLQSTSSFDKNRMRNMNNTYGYNSTGDDRVELIRQLGELTDKLSRSGNLIEKNVPLDHLSFQWDHHVSENWYPNSSRQLPYQNRYGGFSLYGHRDEMISNSSYPLSRLEYGDSRSHSLGRGLYETHAPYQQHIYKGPYMDDRRGTNGLAFHNQHHSFPSRENCNERISDPYSRYQNLMRLQGYTNSEADGFNRRRPTRVHLVSTAKKHRPYTGGAPFLTCCNCFELLLFPKILQKNNRKKLRCGSCSMVLTLAVSDKSIVFYVDTRDVVVKIGDPHHSILDRVGSDSFNTHPDGVLRKERMTSSSFNCDNSNYDFQPMNRFAEGKISGHSTHGNDSIQKSNAPEILMKDSLETEMDLSSSECFTTGTTFHSAEGSRERDQQKGSTVIESFFTDIMKKTFSKTNQNEGDKVNVTVNGYPIQDRLIKKAEKLAGPIHPGSYWYDFRAGFWGTMAGPCLGIIPPFIEEFNYPMPENCGGGNTHVYVNGRELNQKDLNLLASRGLPTESNRSYIVEISGRILDEDTGEELEGLGKLAPTVEKSQRGFGMRDPTSVLAR